jgi:hypothetical protein
VVLCAGRVVVAERFFPPGGAMTSSRATTNADYSRILFSVRSIRSAVSARPPRGGRVSRSNPNPTYPTPNPKRRPRR